MCLSLKHVLLIFVKNSFLYWIFILGPLVFGNKVFVVSMMKFRWDGSGPFLPIGYFPDPIIVFDKFGTYFQRERFSKSRCPMLHGIRVWIPNAFTWVYFWDFVFLRTFLSLKGFQRSSFCLWEMLYIQLWWMLCYFVFISHFSGDIILICN